MDEKEGFENHFWYLELKFGVDLLSLGNVSRLFDPSTGSLKMRNHFPVILALLILYQLPYKIKKKIGPDFQISKLVGSLLVPKRGD